MQNRTARTIRAARIAILRTVVVLVRTIALRTARLTLLRTALTLRALRTALMIALGTLLTGRTVLSILIGLRTAWCSRR